MATQPPSVDPEVAAAAALARQEATAVDVSAQYGRDENGRPIVPGFTTDPVTPEPLLPGDPVAAQSEPVVVEPAAVLPSFQADTTGIEGLLELDDDDTEEVEPPDIAAEADDDVYVDPDDELAKLRADKAKLEKKLAWEQNQRVKQGRKNWLAEAQRRFPLAPVDQITASSRNATLKEAAKLHAQVEKIVAPAFKALEEARAGVLADAELEGRQNAASRWGPPTSGPPQEQIEHGQRAGEEAALDRRNFKGVRERTAALMRSGKLNI